MRAHSPSVHMADTQNDFLKAYDEYADALFRYCVSKVSDRDVAKDLLQETFAKTWEYIAAGNEVANLKAFLYKTLNNLVIDTYRKKKAMSLDVLQEDGFDPPDEMQVQAGEMEDGRRAMQQLRAIPEIYRDVIFMRYVNGLELSEIAEITGESENTVSVRIHRGIKKLKELYDPFTRNGMT